MGTVDDARAFALRDRDEELRLAERMRGRLVLHDVHAEGPFTYRLDELDESLATLEILREAGDEVKVEWPEGARPYHVHRPTSSTDLKLRVRRAEAWFAVEGGAELEGLEVPLAALLDAVRKNLRYVEVKPRHFARIERELLVRLRGLSDVLFRAEGKLAVGAAAAPSLGALLGDDAKVAGDEAFDALRRKLDEARSVTAEVPAALRAELRPYQAEGFRWLHRLSLWGAGAVLADEMGLGKTLQALALLLARADEGPALIVAPTSVASVWLDEAARFTPTLTLRAFHGPGREAQLEGLGPGVVVVTSYDVLARDVEALSAIDFATLVLDEAQAVKNARTRRARAAARVRARARIALTGTPVENHLGELHSLFYVVSPGLLGSWDHFRARFAAPIERDGDEERKARLTELLRPFLLRRTKAEVALDLPARTEVTRSVDLSEPERRLYETARRSALTQLTTRGGPEQKDRFAVLAALTKLRLLACHPRLVDPTSTVPSAKLEVFVELVRDLLAEGHRALVFSQFTSHLKLVQERLDALGVPSLYLDGQTPAAARRARVQRFQEGDEPLFLISLRAGGTGLNLTAADYVVHLDPWWNPAVEDQASDRAHRIGQTRPVTVVRLVSQDTIEETVMALHASKRELLDDLLEGGDAAGKATPEELLALLRSATSHESLDG
jgi:SNF2 family DNA or RNA helicase